MMHMEATKEKINLNALTNEERKRLTKNTWAGKSYFQTLFAQDQIEMDCQTESMAFRTEIERILLEKKLIQQKMDLENLHEVLSEDMKAYNFEDGVNQISTHFYDTDEQFTTTYHQYIRFLRENFLKEPFFFQATPTIRIHCPHGRNSHHYPRYHSDISYGHPPEELNIWIPLTQIMEGHGFQTMSVAESRSILERFDFDFTDFIHSAIHDKEFSATCEGIAKPVTTPFGKMLAFDSRCIHSGEPLKSHTRISMDIRIIPVSRYNEMDIEYQGSGRRKILFTPGNCYPLNDSDHL